MSADEVLTCEWCGEPFSRPHGRGPKPKFCSAAHRQAAHRCRSAIDPAVLEGLMPKIDPAVFEGLMPKIDPAVLEGLMPKIDPAVLEGLMPKFDPAVFERLSSLVLAGTGAASADAGQVSEADVLALILVLAAVSTTVVAAATAHAQLVAAWAVEQIWMLLLALWKAKWTLENESPEGDMAVTAATFLLGYAVRGLVRQGSKKAE